MKYRNNLSIIYIFVFTLIFSAGFPEPASAIQGKSIKLNQAGFHPNASKLAVIPVGREDLSGVSDRFHVIETVSGEEVFNGTITAPQYWSHSEEWVSLAPFSGLTEPGIYRVEHDDFGSSHEFEIHGNVWEEVTRSALKAYYYNRASTALDEALAGPWARPKGHPDNEVIVHSSAAAPGRPAGTIISSPKGWYDAGDYNKYIVNSGITTYTLMAAWEHFPNYFESLDAGIPESGGPLPDLPAEIRWNLDWMMTMQDPHDGGVYHKLTSPNFSGIVMPHQDTAPRYVVQKSTAATLNFAAVMATAARVYKPFDPVFADNALQAAEKAWQWAVEHPEVYYNQSAMNAEHSPNINTGEYGDNNVRDEFDWAAAELYITTRDDSYWHERDLGNVNQTGIPWWGGVRPLAWVSLAHHRHNLTDAADIEHIESRILAIGEDLRNAWNNSPYMMSMGRNQWEFNWGSNSTALNHSLMLLQAYRLTGNSQYRHAAQSNFDYVLGRNPLGTSYVTGVGRQTPMDPHHRPSAAGSADEPVPGFVVGGPNPNNMYDCGAGFYPSDLPAKAWVDDWCSYSTNEVAINWNAPLVYVAGAMQAIYQESESRVRARLSVFPGHILSGGYAELVWNATGAAELVTLNGNPVGTTGTMEVNPADTTEYTLIVTGTGGEADTSRVTVHVVPPEQYNHAFLKPVEASSSIPGHEPGYAVDWNSGTWWSSEPRDDAWIGVDLEKVYEINRFTLHWGAEGFGAQYDLLISLDGVRWQTIHEERQGTGGFHETEPDQPVRARYVRIQGLQRGTDAGYHLREFGIYGELSEIQPSQIVIESPLSGQVFDTGTDIRIIAGIGQGTLPPGEVRFLVNEEPRQTLTEEPWEYIWTAGEPDEYEISVAVTDDEFTVYAQPVTITVREIPETLWFETEDAELSGGAERHTDDEARNGTYVHTGPEGRLRWNGFSVTRSGDFEIRVGYRLAAGETSTLELGIPPLIIRQVELEGEEPAVWRYVDIPDVPLNQTANAIILTNNGSGVDIEYLAVRGDGIEAVDAEWAGDLPGDFVLKQNYPNPFNPATVIRFHLPVDTEVRLEVFDMLGRRIAVLVDERMQAGKHEMTFDGSRLSSGVYVYRLRAADFNRTRRMMLIR